MGEALQLVVGGPQHAATRRVRRRSRRCCRSSFRIERYAPILKWLTLALFAYVARAARRAHPVGASVVGRARSGPAARADAATTLTMLVAVLGTTISPYLFFWQASQEVEEQRATARRRAAARRARAGAREHLRRIKIDTLVGMALLEPDRVLHHADDRGDAARAGITDIQTVGAGGARRCGRVAGEFAFAAVRARHHRHRPARRAGARRLGRLRGRRGCSAGRSGLGAGVRTRRAASTASSSRRPCIGVGDRLLRRSTRSRRWSGARWSTA